MQADLQAHLDAKRKNIIQKLKDMETNPTWALQGKDPCNMYSIQIEDRIACKGVKTINYPFDKVIEFLNHPESLYKLNHDLIKFQTIHTASDNDYIVIYMEFKGVWPVQNRDLVCLTVRQQEGDKYYIATQSVNYPYSSNTENVRAQLYIGGYIIQKVDENTTTVTYISDSDMKGSVPGMIKNIISCEHAVIASKIQPAMQKEGI